MSTKADPFQPVAYSDLANPIYLTLVDSVLFFSSGASMSPRELHCILPGELFARTVTAALSPTSEGSNPSNFSVIAGRLVFMTQLTLTDSAWWSVNATGSDLRQEAVVPSKDHTNGILHDGMNAIVTHAPNSPTSWIWRYTPAAGAEMLPKGSEYAFSPIVLRSIAVLDHRLVILNDDYVASGGNPPSPVWTYAPGDPYGPQQFAVDFQSNLNTRLVAYEDWAYLTIDSPATGSELWRMRWRQQPELVVDIVAGSMSSFASPVTVHDGSLFFIARPRLSNAFHLWRLAHQPGNSSAPPVIEVLAATGLVWQGDFAAVSTPTGLVMGLHSSVDGWQVLLYTQESGLELLAGVSGRNNYLIPSSLTVAGDSVLFYTYDGVGGIGLWRMEPGGAVSLVESFDLSFHNSFQVVGFGDRVLMTRRSQDTARTGRLLEWQPGLPPRFAAQVGRLRSGVTHVHRLLPFNGTAVAMVTAEGVGFSLELLEL